MGKVHIGAAFGYIVRNSTDDNGMRLAAKVACRLTDMSPSAVRSLDSDLNFSVRSMGLKPSAAYTVAERINWRRASLLIHRTIGPNHASPASFDADLNEAYVRTWKRQEGGARPTRHGPYLGSSYWAYSKHAERIKTRQAWPEAIQLVRAGKRVAESATLAHRAIFARWFGNSATQAAIDVLNLTLNGLENECTGVGYAGPHAQGNLLDLQEVGFAGDGRASDVKPGPAWGTAQGSIPGYICLESKFFDDAATSGLRSVAHTTTGGMEVSRGGAVLHEATHLFGKTADVRLDDQVFTQLNIVREAKHADEKAYGPKVCAAFAIAQAVDTVRNADSYRLFCEDAYAA